MDNLPGTYFLAPAPQGAGKENIYLAKGFLGQYIFIIPEYDMVVVITGDAENREDRNKPLKFLYSHILPAVTVNRARKK